MEIAVSIFILQCSMLTRNACYMKLDNPSEVLHLSFSSNCIPVLIVTIHQVFYFALIHTYTDTHTAQFNASKLDFKGS